MKLWFCTSISSSSPHWIFYIKLCGMASFKITGASVLSQVSVKNMQSKLLSKLWSLIKNVFFKRDLTFKGAMLKGLRQGLSLDSFFNMCTDFRFWFVLVVRLLLFLMVVMIQGRDCQFLFRCLDCCLSIGPYRRGKYGGLVSGGWVLCAGCGCAEEVEGVEWKQSVLWNWLHGVLEVGCQHMWA